MRREILSEISRRSFLAGSAASVAASPALAQRGRPPSTEVDCVDRRRRRRRHRRGAAASRDRAQLHPDRGVEPDRRALLRRDRELRRAVRPRRASDLQPGQQSADQACRRAPGSRFIRRRRRSASASAGATPARASLRIISPPSVRASRAMQAPRGMRGDPSAAQRGAAGPRRVAVHRGVCARPLFQRQGPRRRSRRSISAAPTSRDTAAICRQGYGALLAKLAEGIPVQLDTAVKLVDVTGRGSKVELSTNKGAIVGRFCIITASTNVVLDRIKFDGDLPKRHQEAFEKLKLGSFDHIALELQRQSARAAARRSGVREVVGPRTAALVANVGGTPLSVVEVGGKFGRDLAAQGDKAMVEFAVEWLTGMFGPAVKKALGRTPGHAMEQGAVDAGRLRERLARRAVRAPHADGAGPRPGLFRRRGGARDGVGHGRRRLGVRRARGRRGRPPASLRSARAEGAGRDAAASRADSAPTSTSSRRSRGAPRQAVGGYSASRSFSHSTMVSVMCSAGWPGVRPMWWPSG